MSKDNTAANPEKTSQDEMVWLFSKTEVEKSLPDAIKTHFGSESVTPEQVRQYIRDYLKPMVENGSIPDMEVTLYGDMYSGDIKIVLERKGAKSTDAKSEKAA